MGNLPSDQIDRRINNSEVSSQSPPSQYMALNEASRLQDISDDARENIPESTAQIGQYAPLHPSTRSWEVPREQVTIEKIIGKGAFGQVAKGTTIGLRGRPQKTLVAIKMLKGVNYFLRLVKLIVLSRTCNLFCYSLRPLIKMLIMFIILH